MSRSASSPWAGRNRSLPQRGRHRLSREYKSVTRWTGILHISYRTHLVRVINPWFLSSARRRGGARMKHCAMASICCVCVNRRLFLATFWGCFIHRCAQCTLTCLNSSDSQIVSQQQHESYTTRRCPTIVGWIIRSTSTLGHKWDSVCHTVCGTT